MRTRMLIAAALAASFAAPTLAHAQGMKPPAPAGAKSSNIGPSDTASPIAPRLPAPMDGQESPRDLLTQAKGDLAAHRTGAAQEALEQAETRMLARTVDPSMASMPDHNPMVRQIAEARRMLGAGDTAGASRLIDGVLSAN